MLIIPLADAWAETKEPLEAQGWGAWLLGSKNGQKMIPQTQIVSKASIYFAKIQHSRVYHSSGWKTEMWVSHLNLKAIWGISGKSRWPLSWLVGSISRGIGGFGIGQCSGGILGTFQNHYSLTILGSGLVAGAALGSFWLTACEGWFSWNWLFWTFPVLGNRNLGLVSQTASLQPVMESAWLWA